MQVSSLFGQKIAVLNFIAGIRVLPWIWNLPPTTNVFYPVFAKCVELDIPFCTQVGHTGPLCPSDPGRPIPYIDQVRYRSWCLFRKMSIV